MILRTRHGNIEYRSEFGNASDVSLLRSSWLSSSGLPVTQDAAFGLPALSSVIRGVAEVVASLPFMVYRQGPVKERAPDTWQYELLHDRPSDRCDSFEFFHDVALSLEATQNAFVQKAKFRGRVFELYVLNPQRVSTHQGEMGEKLFDVYLGNGQVQRDLGTDEILHIRGFSSKPGAVAGESLLHVHRDPLGVALAMQGFEGDYFRNGGIPPFWFTGAQNREQAKEMVDAHNAQHQGVGRQWRAGALWGSADVKSIPVSMQDALFVEAKQLSIEDICRIWRWPRRWTALDPQQTPTDLNGEMSENLKLYVLPRLRRIERALFADEDLFWGSGLFGEFLTAALERADYVTRVRGYKDARQGGWTTANEVRELENLPPRPEGNELLVTPVGGAPNPRALRALADYYEAIEPATNGHEPEVELAALLGEG